MLNTRSAESLVISRSKVCPLTWVGSLTCCVRPAESNISNIILERVHSRHPCVCQSHHLLAVVQRWVQLILAGWRIHRRTVAWVWLNLICRQQTVAKHPAGHLKLRAPDTCVKCKLRYNHSLKWHRCHLHFCRLAVVGGSQSPGGHCWCVLESNGHGDHLFKPYFSQSLRWIDCWLW